MASRTGTQLGVCRSRLVFRPATRRPFVVKVAASGEAGTQLVKVRLSVQRRVAFGESVHFVGSRPEMGEWNPEVAPCGMWSEGDVWVAEVLLPQGEQADFKVVVRCADGVYRWDEGENRCVDVAEGLSVGEVLEVNCDNRATVNTVSLDRGDFGRGEVVMPRPSEAVESPGEFEILEAESGPPAGEPAGAVSTVQEAAAEAAAQVVKQEEVVEASSSNGSEPMLSSRNDVGGAAAAASAEGEREPEASSSGGDGGSATLASSPGPGGASRAGGAAGTEQLQNGRARQRQEAFRGEGPAFGGLLAGLSVLLAAPVVGLSIVSIATSGCGLPPGPGSAVGAAQGVAYLLLAGVAGASMVRELEPEGEGNGVQEASEMLAWLLLLASGAAAGTEVYRSGALPSLVPDSKCWGTGAPNAVDAARLPPPLAGVSMPSFAAPDLSGSVQMLSEATNQATSQVSSQLSSSLKSQGDEAGQLRSAVVEQQGQQPGTGPQPKPVQAVTSSPPPSSGARQTLTGATQAPAAEAAGQSSSGEGTDRDNSTKARPPSTSDPSMAVGSSPALELAKSGSSSSSSNGSSSNGPPSLPLLPKTSTPMPVSEPQPAAKSASQPVPEPPAAGSSGSSSVQLDEALAKGTPEPQPAKASPSPIPEAVPPRNREAPRSEGAPRARDAAADLLPTHSPIDSSSAKASQNTMPKAPEAPVATASDARSGASPGGSAAAEPAATVSHLVAEEGSTTVEEVEVGTPLSSSTRVGGKEVADASSSAAPAQASDESGGVPALEPAKSFTAVEAPNSNSPSLLEYARHSSTLGETAGLRAIARSY